MLFKHDLFLVPLLPVRDPLTTLPLVQPFRTRSKTCELQMYNPTSEQLQTSGNSANAPIELSSLWTYPIKSVSAIQIDLGQLGREGLKGDRRFMITTADGRAVTQRQQPRLATVRASFWGNSYLTLRAHGMPSINTTLPLDGGMIRDANLFGAIIKVHDQGDNVAQWLDKLLRRNNNFMTLISVVKRPMFRLVKAMDDSGRPGGLSDVAPYLVICEESLLDLNTRRAANALPPVPMDRFRPNLVMRGCTPLEEDNWCGFSLGDAQFTVDEPCPRCTVPDVVQSTGNVDEPLMGPMSTLRTYRGNAGFGITFGIYVSTLTPGAYIAPSEVAQIRYC